MSDEPTPAPDRAPSSRTGNIAFLVCGLVLVVFVVGFWLRVNDEQSGATLTAQIADNKRPDAPALPTADLTGDGAPGLPSWYRADGTKQARSVTGAQPIVLNWWASWCGPCIAEAPILRTLADEYSGRVTFIAINAGYQDTKSDARAFVRKHRMTFPVIRGKKADGDAWGMHTFPETFLIGTDGRVSAHIPGQVDEDELRALLDSELEKDRDASGAAA